MRVLHVHSGNLFGGVETFLTTLARCRRHAPSMEMSAALCFDSEIAARLRAEGISTHILGDVRLRRPDTVWRARRALSAVLKQRGCDVVVCHQSWPHAIFGPVVKSAGLPLVVWAHMAQARSHWLDQLAWRVQPELVVCNSSFTASTLPPTVARVEVVYYPVVDISAGARAGHERSAVREELTTPIDDVVIVQVSRMEPLKGQRTSIAAIGALRELPAWTYWMVGGAQRPIELRYMNALREYADALGISNRLRFTGQRSDVLRLLHAADVFCQPNIEAEAFGLSLVEGLAAGLPVVSSAFGGALEIVDPSCGVLVEPGDAPGLASVLERLVKDGALRARLGSNGPARARMLCDPAEQMPRIAEVLGSAARGRHAA
jgi:glycosyltransferase involved in cell wall biosynthesis